MSNDDTPPDLGDETGLLVWFHADAADALEALAKRTRLVGDAVRALGPGPCATVRRELQRISRITCDLVQLQFADLD